MDKKILIFGNFPFNLDNEFIDTNHLALYFSRKGDRVDFITSPAYFVDILVPFLNRVKARMKNYLYSGIPITENLTQYTPLVPLPLRDIFPLNTAFNARLFRDGFRLSRFAREDYDVCFVSQGFMLLWADLVRSKVFVYRYNDLLEGFGSHPPILGEWEERFIKGRCNLVLAVNERLKKHLLTKYPDVRNIKVLPNGVDIEAFRNAQPDRELMSIRKKKVVFCGSIDFWVDVNLMYQLASSLKDIVLVIVGPARISIKKLLVLPNVIYLGSKNFREIPGILKACDVGIIPFVKNKLTEYVERPLKYYEYIAAGLPVVATGLCETDNRNEYVKNLRDREMFIEMVKRVKVYDLDERERIKSAVDNNDWSNIFRTMESYIEELDLL